MRARAALPVPANRRAILGPVRSGTLKEQLMQRELALEDVSFRQSGDPLDVRRRQNLPAEDELLDVGRIAADGVDHRVTERFTLLVSPAAVEIVRRILY